LYTGCGVNGAGAAAGGAAGGFGAGGIEVRAIRPRGGGDGVAQAATKPANDNTTATLPVIRAISVASRNRSAGRR